MNRRSFSHTSRSRESKDTVPMGPAPGDLLLRPPPPAAGGQFSALPALHLRASGLCLCGLLPVLLSVFTWPFTLGQLSGLEGPPHPARPCLNLITSAQTLFPNTLTSQVPGQDLSIPFWGHDSNLSRSGLEVPAERKGKGQPYSKASQTRPCAEA